MPVLKLSYYQLESPLKSCFGYCALFPKDYQIDKEMLIRLWIAQGYIFPSDHQSMEDVAEEYFSILLRRCFFQDVRRYANGDIESCKIHDLMHGVAQEVTRKEICTLNSVICDVDKNVRHVSFVGTQFTDYSFTKMNIRSFLIPQERWIGIAKLDSSSVDALLANWKYLRALDLSRLKGKSLPGSISELLHLRYLDLSHNESLEVLPRSFAKLYNLQTLILYNCSQLKELPKDMSKLVELRVLDISSCNGLTYLPKGMGKLTCLHTLPMYVLGDKSRSREKWFDGLQDLKSLNNLKGHLRIQIPYLSGIPVEGMKDILGNAKEDGGRKGGCLMNMKHLYIVTFNFDKEESVGRVEYDEAVFEVMQPHSNLKTMFLYSYYGVKMPGWAMDDNLATFLPNLVLIYVFCCPKLQNLGCLGNLRHLEVLYVDDLPNLEYIIGKSKTEAISEEGFSFFPSLEKLELRNLQKLKGWVGDNDELHSKTSVAPLCLSQLKWLKVYECPEMIDILVCPILESLSLMKFNKSLQIISKKVMNEELLEENSTITNTPLFSSSTSFNITPKLREVIIDDVAWLNSQPKEVFQCLSTLWVDNDDKVENLGEVGVLFNSCSSSLRSLKLHCCHNLRSVSGGLEHLTALVGLVIFDCPKLKLSEGEEREREEGIGMPWGSRFHSLTSLTLSNLSQLVDLPNWVQFLTALKSLTIENCEGIEELPNWMPKLTSLNNLEITNCSARLKVRCQDSSRQDWHLIQHIPSVTIRDW